MEFSSSKDAVAKFGLPKKVWKDFKLLNKPYTVVRGATVDIVDALTKASESPSKDSRLALSGTSGSGKSYVLFQAVDWAVANGWLVLYLPRAVNFVNSTTTYTYDPRTQTFLQPEAAYQTLHRAREANKGILENIKASSALAADGVKPISAGTVLYDAMNVTREEVASAPVILDWVMSELEVQTDYPVLLAIDDFQALFNRTSYRDPHFKPIASYHLSMPRLLLSYASGRRSFARGAVVGSLTSSDPQFPITPELDSSLDLASYNENDAPKLTMPWPYVQHSRFLSEYAGGLVNIRVPRQLSMDEAGAVYEIWMEHRFMSSKAHDELFMSKYVESGGNARDFVWKGLLGTLQT
ncbi:hypothetical protein AGABI1DRAFT_52006 [Agaricus bisporus var. burnettii JB137-S8]|nr:uncharacterized protein AGABI1DRAFT_52006 [Agaricus bisporus var. burnettii JB137-S8]EKM84200.1 hypothetical protein AGABI1DRAFT_52006 [Agaricus bisporus var. burnettii JB137-S8]